MSKNQKYGINIDRNKFISESGIVLIVSDPNPLTEAHTIHRLDSVGCSISNDECTNCDPHLAARNRYTQIDSGGAKKQLLDQNILAKIVQYL